MHKSRGKRIKVLAVVLLLLIVILVSIVTYICNSKNPRIRLFLSVIHFTEKTLDDPGYLLHDIDIMEFLRDYSNADTQLTGKTGFSKIKNLKGSITVDMDTKRSFSQKRSSNLCRLNYLGITVGNINIYKEDETIYLLAPLLGDDIGYAFPTGIDLFMKMPELTSDINQKWFHDNMANIISLMQEIQIVQTGCTITDDDGITSEEFIVTIPQGYGNFIWELLGMNTPDYDVTVTMYLTADNVMTKMVLHLDDVLPGASMVFEGSNTNQAYFYYELPDNERMEMIMVRNPDELRWFDITMTYFTNTNEEYTFTTYLTWNEENSGFSMVCHNMKFTRGDELLATGYFDGTIVPLSEKPNIFGSETKRLYSLEKLDWKEIRNDTSSFINDVLDQTTFGEFTK